MVVVEDAVRGEMNHVVSRGQGVKRSLIRLPSDEHFPVAGAKHACESGDLDLGIGQGGQIFIADDITKSCDRGSTERRIPERHQRRRNKFGIRAPVLFQLFQDTQ